MAGQTLLQFSKRITKTGEQVAVNADRLVRAVALVADQIVVMGTPVDTGRAKSNWIVSLGSATTGEIGPYAPGEGGNTAQSNEAAALAQAERVIGQYDGDMGVGIHITNNVPYIEELNQGSSPQAPPNFVEDGIASAVSIIRSRAAKIIGGGNFR